MELASTTSAAAPGPDVRPKLLPPPPVQLLAIADVRLTALNGSEKDLDTFYVGLLKFERDLTLSGVAYRAEKFSILFDFLERPMPRGEMRIIGVAVPSLPTLIGQMSAASIAFTYQRSITAGLETILCEDPAGNLLEIRHGRDIA